jgi:hypothetical protein
MNSNSRYVHATDCCDVLEQAGAYQRIKDPKEKDIRKNLPCSVWFEFSPQRSSGTDGDSLDQAEETGGADGKSPSYPFHKNSFTTNITRKFLK